MKRLSFISYIRTHVHKEERPYFNNQYDFLKERRLSVMHIYESIYVLLRRLSDAVALLSSDIIDHQGCLTEQVKPVFISSQL